MLPKEYFQDGAELAEMILAIISQAGEGEEEERNSLEEIKRVALCFAEERGKEMLGKPTFASAAIELIEEIQETKRALEILQDSAEVMTYARDILVLGKFGSQLKTPGLFRRLEELHPGITRPLRRPGD